MKQLTIVVPVYNEKDGILSTIKEIRELKSQDQRLVEVLLVDDGSTDGTSELLKNNITTEDAIKVITHKKNKGYGASLKTGVAQAKSDYICITDADRTYPNSKIPELFDLLLSNELDMLVGSRTSKNSKIPLIRRPAKWVLNQLANYLTETKIPDLNSGLRVFKAESLRKFTYILPDGFSFTTTITLAMLTNNYDVEYTEIDYFHRAGSSKIRPIYDTLNFTQLIIRTILLFNPLKIFIPMFYALFGVGLLLLFSRAFLGTGMGVVTAVVLMGAIQLLAIGMLADLIDRRDRK
jgi:glycosyltransferase involved in cell wall biosynthesis